MNLNEIAAKSKPIFAAHNVQFAGIFGSVARGEETPASDVDLLVTIGGHPSLVELIQLERELAEALMRRVDLVPAQSLHPRLRSHVLAELRDLYGKRPAL